MKTGFCVSKKIILVATCNLCKQGQSIQCINQIFVKKSIFLSLCLILAASLVQAQNRETRNVGGFTKISFRIPGKLYLKQGSTQKVEIEGDKDVIKEIETEVEGSRLEIGREGKRWSWSDSDTKDLKVYITMPTIEGVSVSGSGDVVGEGKITATALDLNVSGSGALTLDADVSGNVDADVSGSGDINLSGKCKAFDSDVSGSGKISLSMNIEQKADLGVSGSGRIEAKGSAESVEANISGSGKVLAANLETTSCEVRISGSGDVEINVTKELDANITGSGTVQYKGNPSKVNSHASGSGKVSKM